MNTPRHCSPGPWIMKDVGQTFLIHGSEEDSPIGKARAHICSMSWHASYGHKTENGRTKRVPAPSERQIAQARLITNAPRMWDLLYRLQDHYRNDNNDLILELGSFLREVY